jgi:hypothetical protein
MKKLITLIIVADLALTMQAQDITNTLGTNGTFKINEDGGTTIATIKSDGKVGIGTDDPKSTLDVAGSVSVSYAGGGSITLDESHYVYGTQDQAVTTLPTAVGIEGRVYIIKMVTTGTATVQTSNNENIDVAGTTSYSLTAQGKYVRLISNGAAWLIIGQN